MPKIGTAAGGPSGNIPAPLWVVGILNGIRAPITKANVLLLELWAQQEGDGLDNNNPFNVAGTNAGSTFCYAQCGTSSPIMHYSSLADGTAVNVAFIQQQPGLAPMLVAMRNGASLASIYAAMNAWFGQQSWASPNYPGTVQSYLDGGISGPSAPFSNGATTNYTVNTTAALTSGASGGNANGMGCQSKGNILSTGGVLGVGSFSFTYCQLKAITGGFIMVAGAAAIVGGLALIVVTGLGGAGPLAGVVKAASPVAAGATKVGSMVGGVGRRRSAKAASAEKEGNAQQRDRAATMRSDSAAVKRARPSRPNSAPAGRSKPMRTPPARDITPAENDRLADRPRRPRPARPVRSGDEPF